jgi:hypothetical protein
MNEGSAVGQVTSRYRSWKGTAVKPASDDSRRSVATRDMDWKDMVQHTLGHEGTQFQGWSQITRPMERGCRPQWQLEDMNR